MCQMDAIGTQFRLKSMILKGGDLQIRKISVAATDGIIKITGRTEEDGQINTGFSRIQ